MEFSTANGPIHALQLIDKHSAVYTPHGDGQSERIRLHFASQRTNYCEPTCPVVPQIGQDQSRPAFRLFSANLGIEIDEDDITGVWNVRRHHSTFSRPTSASVETSAYRFSGVIWATI